MKRISRHISPAQPGGRYEVETIFEGDNGRMFRVVIKRDSYDNQCAARVETWLETTGWSPVSVLPALTVAAQLSTFNKGTVAQVLAFEAQLLKTAAQVVR